MENPEILKLLSGVRDVRAFVNSLTSRDIIDVLSDWTLWRLPYQTPPEGDWTRWIMRGGRGIGKTFIGGKTTNETARDKSKIKSGEIGILGRTFDDARSVMVEGPSGILATAPPDFVPLWEPGKKLLTWPNGVRGKVRSADKPEGIRGLNASWVWGDEPAHWPDLLKTWMEVIEPALRIGWARSLLTTTPIRNPDLQKIEELPGSVVTRASTFDNPYLSKKVRDRYMEIYEGTRVGRQELLGEYLLENENALWTWDSIENNRLQFAPESMARVVVAVDPAVTANAGSDETGIVVVGSDRNGHGYVLADRTMKGSPAAWGRMAIAAYRRFRADLIVAEVNNGGDLVEANIRGLDSRVNFKAVRASRGKVTRAEPVAALYERSLIHHCGVFDLLEEQQTTWDASRRASPDRVDALVWAIHELFLQAGRPAGPISAYL